MESAKLRIPMRGYEIELRILAVLLSMLRIPMRGYENATEEGADGESVLRIPMRGYENYHKCENVYFFIVTNPHAGL